MATMKREKKPWQPREKDERAMRRLTITLAVALVAFAIAGQAAALDDGDVRSGIQP
jgi:hypothetical protein